MPDPFLNRRDSLRTLFASTVGLGLAPASAFARATANDRCVGLLIGSLLGDAMGGPLEFANEDTRGEHVVGARQWGESRRLDRNLIAEISEKAQLMSYESVRPGVAPYGPWLIKAPAGTVTDDSRWKIILMRAVRKAQASSDKRLSRMHIARAIRDFRPRIDTLPSKQTNDLIEEGLREYRYAANWVLGERDPKLALPLDRLWAGIPNCSGQMMLLPLAVANAGDAETAYRESFELNFIDNAGAKDIASMLVASIASILDEDSDSLSSHQRWNNLLHTMETVDPYRLKAVPFAGRPLDKWLRLVDDIVDKADGRPAVAYQLLETEAKPVYYWDAHFTLVVALTILKLCNFDAMCSLALAIDFGHDTDSYAQLIGALAGAVDGPDAFPMAMRQDVTSQLLAQYNEDVSNWVSELAALRSPHKPQRHQ